MKALITSIVLILVISTSLVYPQSGNNNLNLESFGQQFLESINSGRTGSEPGGDAINERILTGFVSGDNFGNTVSSAGDVNGDGYDDLIVGAYLNDAGGTSAGRAYIYYGGSVFNAAPDVILTGDSAFIYFGSSVSSAGDVNSDGYDDVIVGAHRSASFKGRAYLFLGGANMDNVSDLTFAGVNINDNFGFSVSGAGDLNGDGFSDVIIGAYGFSTNTGRAYVYYGGALMNNVADVTLSGEAASNLFGYSVSNAGDVNGDGYSDVIAGAYAYSSSTGRAYIYYGGTSMNSVADVVMTGEAASSTFGVSVSTAGDVNRDGYSDVVVGSPGYASFTGRAYLYNGGASMNNVSDVTFLGEAGTGDFGISVSEAGDINGDGFSDLIIGAEDYNSNGRAYIFNGSAQTDNIPDKYITGEALNDNFGCSVSSAGDVNGDGYFDFIAGAELNDAGGSSAGRVYLYMNMLIGVDTEDLIFDGEDTTDNFGYSVASAGDVNGDGYDDVIVGAKLNDENGNIAGKSYIYFGGLNIDYVADVTMTGVAAGDQFGYSVAGAGDVNGDGYDDVIVGAPFNDAVNNSAGRAYVFYGGAAMNNTADVTLSGSALNEYLGLCVSGAGDVNGDGYSDVMVTSIATGGDFIYYGGSPMNNTSDVTLTSTGTEFGISSSSAGDFNGDGFDDVIVGVPNTTNGNARIFFGGISMNGTSDLVLTGETSGDDFGISVSQAGDVNGDGYGDVIVGAYLNDSAGLLSGSAYIYYGGLFADDAADLILRGVKDYDLHGGCVAGAGDLNGDGFDDVIVSAYDEQPTFYRGTVYIYHGGADMDSQYDLTMSGTVIEEFFGIPAAGAGDMNGDGLSDIIVGSYGYSGIYNDAGKATIFLSSSYTISPTLVSVKDVPLDQGGKVKLKWLKSGYDTRGINRITNYIIYRSNPPGTTGYEWEEVGSVSAAFMPAYTFTADTDHDSTGNSNATFFFKIAARTSDIQEIWESNIISGYSVDNLAPFAPSSLAANADNNSIILSWNANQEPDLHHYIIYRDGVELATTQSNGYDDTAVMEDSTYEYQIAAVDVHGNISSLSNSANATLNGMGVFNITAIIQGYYNETSNFMNANDTATLQLKSATSPFAEIETSVSVLNAGTLTTSFNISSAPAGSFYLVLKHRNSIQTWSASPVAYTPGGVSVYNFTTSASQAFGNNLIQADSSPIRFAIFSGDVNQDETVDATDLSLIDNDAFNFVGGYVSTDLTGDEFVDATDFAIADNNAANFVSAILP